MQIKLNGGSPFRIRRPLITTSGFSSDVDPTVELQLRELNDLLAKRIVDVTGEEALIALLRTPLRPRRMKSGWPEESLGSVLSRAEETPEAITLADYIDRTPELSELKYAMHESVLGQLFSLDYNAKAVLDRHPAITDYLLTYAYHVMDIEEIHGLKSFLSSNRLGVRNVTTYAVISAARVVIAQEHIKVSQADSDTSDIIKAIAAAQLKLSTASFKPALHALINDHIFNSKESKLIDDANVGKLPIGLKPELIKLLKSSPVPITHDNVKLFLPAFIAKAQGVAEVVDASEADAEPADQDFDVEFFTDDQGLIQVSVSAVKCASQLYYGMVLGDELEVFEAMTYFTHKYLLRESIEIQNRRLREDLQLYVFSNKFVDLKTKKVVDRTRPAERRMFYRQVFNYGGGQITEDMVVNRDFPRLWKLLILESANYLERARESFNPSGYVSKQNVMQAVEDLQYNLSTHCTGMANVVTPLIYAELDFVIRRIFMHPEILRQVVPSGGTWWRVVETLYLAMRRARPKSTVLYNKAKLGHEILRSIATYDPSTFEDDESFSSFISTVDAFITTQSILQAALTDDLKQGEPRDAAEPSGNDDENGVRLRGPEPADGPGARDADGGASEWDF